MLHASAAKTADAMMGAIDFVEERKESKRGRAESLLGVEFISDKRKQFHPTPAGPLEAERILRRRAATARQEDAQLSLVPRKWSRRPNGFSRTEYRRPKFPPIARHRPGPPGDADRNWPNPTAGCSLQRLAPRRRARRAATGRSQ